MNEVQQNTYIGNLNSYPLAVNNRGPSELYELKAHESDNMKVKRPNISGNELPAVIPEKVVYSDYEANNKLRKINNEIYKEATGGMDISQFKLKPLNTDIFEQKKTENKEDEKHGFNFKRYLTILGLVALLTATIAYFRRGKG